MGREGKVLLGVGDAVVDVLAVWMNTEKSSSAGHRDKEGWREGGERGREGG